MKRLNILQSNLVVSIIGLIMIASTASLLLYVWEDDKRDDRRQTIQDQKIERLAAENLRINEISLRLQEQDVNLTAAQSRGLVKAMNTTFQETLPQIQEEFEIHKEQVAKHDETLKDALKNQEAILEKIDNDTLLRQVKQHEILTSGLINVTDLNTVILEAVNATVTDEDLEKSVSIKIDILQESIDRLTELNISNNTVS